MARGFVSTADTYPRRLWRSPETARVTVTLDGETLEAFEGETLLATILSAHGWVLRSTERHHAPRGMFCGMGVCMDCLVHIAEEGITRACSVVVRPGLICHTLHPVEGMGYPIP